MTAVQSFLKNLANRVGDSGFGPLEVAHLLQGFFRDNLADVSYMTALICLHDPNKGEVQWLSCGAPGLIISDADQSQTDNDGSVQKGGLPIGLFADTFYTKDNLVVDELTPTSVCIAVTDGIYELSKDVDGFEKIPGELLRRLRCEFVEDAREHGSLVVASNKYIAACQEYGYVHLQDDVTILLFGPRCQLPGIFEMTVPLSPTAIDDAARTLGDWGRNEGWTDEALGRVQLVLEEQLMNVYAHGFDDADRIHEVAGIRLLTRRSDDAELTVWDYGTIPPSMAVAAGDTSTAFELINREMSNHGRGRLMIRELCSGIERKRFGELNETVYHVRIEPEKEKAE